MPSNQTRHQARFVTACQQLLALAVVCAALTPAVSVISLDVVSEAPQAGSAAALMSAYGEEALKTSKLPTGPVQAKVREIALTQPAGGKTSGRLLQAATPNARVKAVAGGTELTSVPQAVTGYGAVGVTWAHGDRSCRARL